MGSVRWDPLRALQLQDLPGASQCGRAGGGRGRLGEQWKCRGSGGGCDLCTGPPGCPSLGRLCRYLTSVVRKPRPTERARWESELSYLCPQR